MKQQLERIALPAGKEPVGLEGTYRSNYRGFAIFLICCALLLAAFAVSALLLHRESEGEGGSVGLGDTSADMSDTANADSESSIFDEPQEIPEGAIPVVTADLSYLHLGVNYLHNETLYRPDIEALLQQDVTCKTEVKEPLVLILHTHTSESYLPSGTDYLSEQPGNVTYSRDEAQNVLAVGETLCNTLNQAGVPTVHCKTLHDDPTLSGSYDRSEETVRAYLKAYPSIEYVIDLHRDAVLTADGSYIRAATGRGEEAVAQVMAVVGTDGNGTLHPNWRSNLALGLQLREALNQKQEAMCRPVSLRNASYHQELAPHALLLEIGTGACSVEEAKRAAVLVGAALADILLPVTDR